MFLEVKGIDELKNKISDVRDKVSDSDLVKKVAYVIERQAKKNASGRPGPRVKSGRLRNSIMTRMTGSNSAKVTPEVNYAKFVEYGHSQTPGRFVYAIKRRLVANYSPAYPFMEPTIEQTKGEIDGVCVSFGNKIEDEWNK